jgi:hypothetical protein
MQTRESRIEPSAAILESARQWLAPVRAALDTDFLAAYLTGSVLSAGFDPQHSRVNVLVFARALTAESLDRLAAAIPVSKKGTQFEPLFLTKDQVAASLDVFPMEWLDLIERHMRLEGEDVFEGVQVPRTWLRHQCEHELRGKHIRLRQEYLASGGRADRLKEVLARFASGFHTLFRTLLRLRGEEPPASTERVIERVADAYGLDARALLGAWMMRYAAKSEGRDVKDVYRRFMTEIERLIAAIDGLRVS